jgi:uncharacterized protein YjiS (DUF1127 family)
MAAAGISIVTIAARLPMLQRSKWRRRHALRLIAKVWRPIMTAIASTAGITPLLPHNLMYVGADRALNGVTGLEGRTAGGDLPGSGGPAWFDRMVQAVTRYLSKRTALHELRGMTDRQLDDIGLARSDISRVFEAGFKAPRDRC